MYILIYQGGGGREGDGLERGWHYFSGTKVHTLSPPMVPPKVIFIHKGGGGKNLFPMSASVIGNNSK